MNSEACGLRADDADEVTNSRLGEERLEGTSDPDENAGTVGSRVDLPSLLRDSCGR